MEHLLNSPSRGGAGHVPPPGLYLELQLGLSRTFCSHLWYIWATAACCLSVSCVFTHLLMQIWEWSTGHVFHSDVTDPWPLLQTHIHCDEWSRTSIRVSFRHSLHRSSFQDICSKQRRNCWLIILDESKVYLCECKCYQWKSHKDILFILFWHLMILNVRSCF